MKSKSSQRKKSDAAQGAPLSRISKSGRVGKQSGTPASVERETPYARAALLQKRLEEMMKDVKPSAKSKKNKKFLVSRADLSRKAILNKSACELERIPEVGYICPECRIFVRFTVRQTSRLSCMMRPPT